MDGALIKAFLVLVPTSMLFYLDFWSAIAGLTLFPLGYLLHVLRKAKN
jgi:hypothetical protein